MELKQAHREWASRPADERFTSLIALAAHCETARDNSAQVNLSTRDVRVTPVEGDTKALVLVGPQGHAANFSHWSFGQLCTRAVTGGKSAPADYLRTLPGALAADNLNYALQHGEMSSIGAYLGRTPSSVLLRAITSQRYGRVHNADIANTLIQRFGDGVTGDFRVPGEFGKRVAVTQANTTLYASDRDMFVFLADEEHRIEIPNRRNGQTGSLARGFFVSNSEVGAGKLSISTFLFDYACSNRTVWGAEGFEEISVRHNSNAPHRWIEEAAPAIQAYATSSTGSIVRAISNARAARIDNVVDFLSKRFTKTQTAAIQAAHMADEGRPIESLWDASVGVTAVARSIPFMNDRVAVEREGGAILKLAA